MTTTRTLPPRPEPMTGPELLAWREHWLLTQSQLAHLLGIHLNTLRRWEQNSREIPLFLRPALETFERELSADLAERSRGLPVDVQMMLRSQQRTATP